MQVKKFSDEMIDPPKSETRVYPFSRMDLGDCFELPSERMGRCRSAASAYGARHGMKFKLRRKDPSTHLCIRIA